MKKIVSTFCFLGVLALTLFNVPQSLSAATLTEGQQATLTAALAEKKSYAEIVSQAKAAGMDAEETVLFLSKNCDNTPACASEIVYAAITGGMDAEQAMSGALRAGAGLLAVVNAGRSAGASREAITAAGLRNGFTAGQISNAFAGTSDGGSAGGGTGGSVFEGTTGGGLTGGGPFGGGAGGNASPHKP